MYGFVNSALEKLIIRRFGEEIWQEICAKAAVVIGEGHSFVTNHIYDDQDTVEVMKAAVEILGIDSGSLLEMFGEQFLFRCRECGYAAVLRHLGQNLVDFLSNLDALHDQISFIYSNMRAPSFRCSSSSVSEEAITLHYYSERRGLAQMVPGIVKSVAREIYGIEVQIECEDVTSSHNASSHAVFTIVPLSGKLLNQSVKRKLIRPTSMSILATAKAPSIPTSVFCQAFPFHIVFDREMKILQSGNRLNRLINRAPSEEVLMTSVFELQRPRMEFTFQNILDHINTVYIVRTAVAPPIVGPKESMEPDRDTHVHLRGQMLPMVQSDCMLYMCSPHTRNLSDLNTQGLFVSDIPIHDATRGLMIAQEALENKSVYISRIEKLLSDKKTLTIQILEEKQKLQRLVAEILPGTVALSLLHKSGVQAQQFECVTILFSDIVGFTRICQRCTPDTVINMLNDLYCYFDQVVSRNNVYKVETIGDAYMVVGGLPEVNKTHAADVCNQAIDMMMCAQKVKDPTNPDKSITIRIGVHSGEVAAGVVGIRMPRYCLFGDTVNVASRTESNSVPGRINVTEWTYVHLCGKPNWIFEDRGLVTFKNVENPLHCYWLIENTERSHLQPPVLQKAPSREIPVFVEDSFLSDALRDTQEGFSKHLASQIPEEVFVDEDHSVRPTKNELRTSPTDSRSLSTGSDAETEEICTTCTEQARVPSIAMSEDCTHTVEEPISLDSKRHCSSSYSEESTLALKAKHNQNRSKSASTIKLGNDSGEVAKGPWVDGTRMTFDGQSSHVSKVNKPIRRKSASVKTIVEQFESKLNSVHSDRRHARGGVSLAPGQHSEVLSGSQSHVDSGPRNRPLPVYQIGSEMQHKNRLRKTGPTQKPMSMQRARAHSSDTSSSAGVEAHGSGRPHDIQGQGMNSEQLQVEQSFTESGKSLHLLSPGSPIGARVRRGSVKDVIQIFEGMSSL